MRNPSNADKDRLRREEDEAVQAAAGNMPLFLEMMGVGACRPRYRAMLPIGAPVVSACRAQGTCGGIGKEQGTMRNPSNADRDRAGIGKHSLAHRALGQGVQVDVRQVNPGHYNATIQTQGNSYARRLFGEQFSADVARTGNGFSATLKPGMGQRRATRATRASGRARRSSGRMTRGPVQQLPVGITPRVDRVVIRVASGQIGPYADKGVNYTIEVYGSFPNAIWGAWMQGEMWPSEWGIDMIVPGSGDYPIPAGEVYRGNIVSPEPEFHADGLFLVLEGQPKPSFAGGGRIIYHTTDGGTRTVKFPASVVESAYLGMGQRRATRRTLRAQPSSPRGPTAEQVCKAKCKLDPDPAGCYDECMGGQGTITARPSYGYGRGGAQWAGRARAAGPLVPSVRCATKCPPGQVCCVDIFGKEYCCDDCGSPLCGLDITAPGGSGASRHRFRVKGAPKRATAVDRARLGHYGSRSGADCIRDCYEQYTTPWGRKQCVDLCDLFFPI